MTKTRPPSVQTAKTDPDGLQASLKQSETNLTEEINKNKQLTDELDAAKTHVAALKQEVEDLRRTQNGHLAATLLAAALATLFSFLAVGVWLKLRSETKGWQGSESESQEALRGRIDNLTSRLNTALESTSSNTGVNLLAYQQERQAASVPKTSEKTPKPTPQPPAAPPSSPEPAARLSSPAEPLAAVEPRTIEPEPRRSTGNPFHDYQYAQTLGEEAGEDWYLANYRTQSLSCVNLNDHRLGTAALYFKPDARGKFLLVEQGGQAQVLPAFGTDFLSGRSSLEGVFGYPPNPGAALTLKHPATVHRTGDTWTLKNPGEFVSA